MSYCFNPRCPRPDNPDQARFCLSCGMSLVVGDRYRALKLLGQGGFGRTLLAVDRGNPTAPRCVIKQFNPTDSNAIEPAIAATLFRQEAERLAQLGQHPQIPALLDYFEQQGRQYLVQDFIDGPNLETALRQHGPFDEAEIRQVLGDLLPVLQFIHQHRVIHRDIKPENIICPLSGDRLMLVDFGAAKHVATAPARTGTVIGSAGYVAPEQAMGRAEFASDLYSLGVTCIHLLTGMHPFDLFSVVEDAWVWPQYLVNPIHPRLQQILTRLLQRATRQRYETATQVLQDLGLEPRSSPPRRDRRPQRLTTPPAERVELAAVPSPPPWACIHTLTGHTGSVTAIALASDGQTLISGSRDRTLRQWDMATGELRQTIGAKGLWFGDGHGDGINALVMTADGRTLISAADDGDIKLWDSASLKLITTLEGHHWSVTALGVDSQGHYLVSGGGDGVLVFWDLDSFEARQRLRPHEDRVSGIGIIPDGPMVISASWDRHLRWWDLPQQRLLQSVQAGVDGISAIALTPDGRTLISASGDKTLKLWDGERGRLEQVVAAHRDRIHCLAVSPDGRLLASGGADSTIQLWPLVGGDRTVQIPRTPPAILHHAWDVNAIAFTADGRFLVSGSADETLKIWQRP